jgi:predicted phage terminase large subunit-like protein
MFKGKHGQMVSTGIFGEITGNKASLIIIDDPFKSNVESESKIYRDKVYDIVKQSCETRLRPTGSALVIIHTRWHEDDLIGRYAREPRTIYINIPEVWDSSFGEDRWLGRKAGEPLCPELGETAQWVQDKLNSLGRKDFNALYQGKPYVDGGNIVQRDSIRFYERADLPTEFDDITLSADLSLGGTTDQSDPACISVWGRKGANHYLLNVVNKKMGLNEQIRSINHLCNSYPRIKRKIVEKKANGSAVIETIKNQVDGVIPYDPKGESKTSRLEAVTHFFEAGNIWFPSEKVMPNIEVFVEQLLKFPNATHDDFVDTLSQYLINYECRNGGKVLTDSCYADLSNALRGLTI